MRYRLGLVGDGPADLALVRAAASLGVDVRVLVTNRDAPAARGGGQVCVATDEAAWRSFAADRQLLTSRDPETLTRLAGLGPTVRPAPLPGVEHPDKGRHIVVVVSPERQAVAYPLTSVRRVDDCLETVTPDLSVAGADELQHLALEAARDAGVVGAVEVWFADRAVTACAPGPSERGLWSLRGAHTSQFDNHVRALLDLPLGDPSTRGFAVTRTVRMAGETDPTGALQHVFARDRGVHVELHPARPGQPLGHVTVCAPELDGALRRVRHAAGYLMGDPDA